MHINGLGPTSPETSTTTSVSLNGKLTGRSFEDKTFESSKSKQISLEVINKKSSTSQIKLSTDAIATTKELPETIEKQKKLYANNFYHAHLTGNYAKLNVNYYVRTEDKQGNFSHTNLSKATVAELQNLKSAKFTFVFKAEDGSFHELFDKDKSKDFLKSFLDKYIDYRIKNDKSEIKEDETDDRLVLNGKYHHTSLQNETPPRNVTVKNIILDMYKESVVSNILATQSEMMESMKEEKEKQKVLKLIENIRIINKINVEQEIVKKEAIEENMEISAQQKSQVIAEEPGPKSAARSTS